MPFVVTPTMANIIVAISTICLILIIPLAALRMYSKIRIVRSFGWDDGGSIQLCCVPLSDHSSIRELCTRDSMSQLSYSWGNERLSIQIGSIAYMAVVISCESQYRHTNAHILSRDSIRYYHETQGHTPQRCTRDTPGMRRPDSQLWLND